MNKPEVTETGLPISGLLRQAIAFVRDFAAFAGLSGVVASVLAVLAASFEGVGLLLLVPLLSLITAPDGRTDFLRRRSRSRARRLARRGCRCCSVYLQRS